MKNTLFHSDMFLSAKSLFRVVLVGLACGLAGGLALPPASAAVTPMSVDKRVDRLTQLVHLTASQKTQAADIFAQEDAALQAFPTSEARMKQGMSIRQKTRADIRALLTPEQQTIYDTAPQRLGGGAMQDAAAVTARVDKVVAFTEAQIPAISALYQQQVADLQALSPADRAGEAGVAIRKATNAQVRALLTPEQQVKFDANPSGSEVIEVRVSLAAMLKTVPAVTALTGQVSRAVPQGGEATIWSTGEVVPGAEGAYTYRITGATATVTLIVTWSRLAGSGVVQITGIADENGLALPLN